MTEPGYTDVPAVIRVLDGMKLSASKQTEGAVKALLRDAKTNSLETHAEIFLVDKGKSALKNLTPRDWAILGIGALVLVGATVGTVKGIEHLRQRRTQKAKSTEAAATREIQLYELSGEVTVAEESVALIVGSDVELAEDQLVITMSAEDWRELLRRAVALNSLEERIWMLLSNVRIEGGDVGVLQWQQRMKKLSPQEVAGEIRRMLEAHPELQANEELAELIRIFINGRSDDGRHEPGRLGIE
ncbi:hypothetical protein NH287_14390 [Microbacterium sp. CnD16-F]|uniref:hypothetical protein n=1 Tax=Microbacterium sp. CnD16-F TaxID=2954493 RepID=UPI002097F926|nr:hypothetical protein [Microbacterium sp. CnD16-F]MCO7204676.1 hypothetical protein [Microbacterium sp. CnD16-F]